MKKGVFCLLFLAVFFILGSKITNSASIVNGYHFDEPLASINDENEYLFIYDFIDSFHGTKGSWTYQQYPEQVIGKSGYAYDFDGANDRIGFQNQNTPVFSSPFTLEMWIKLDSLPSSNHAFTILHSLPVTNAEMGFHMGINSVKCLYIVDPHLGILDSNFCSWNTNQWYHIAFVYDSTYNRLYVNGNSVGQKQYNTQLSGNFNLRYMTIGAECNPCNNFFNGAIDEIKFYDYAKTSFDTNKDIAYKTEKCNSNTDCASGLNCKDDFYYNKVFKRCCEPNECVYNENCYANGAEVSNNIYKCINGEWRIKNKRISGNTVLNLGLNEGSGNTTSDSSGYGNNGKLVGSPLPTRVNGYNSKAVDFTEQNLYTPSPERKHILIADSTSLNLNYSIKVDSYFKYHYPNISCCDAGAILSKGVLYENAWTEQLGYHLFLDGNKVCFAVVTDIYYGYSGTQKTHPSYNKICSVSTINREQWYNIKAVYDGEYIGIYLNGVLENKTIARGKIINTDSWLGTYELLVGADTYTSPFHWRLYSHGINGVIDEVKVYDYAENLGTPIYWYKKCVNNSTCINELCPVPGDFSSCPANQCSNDANCVYVPLTCGNGITQLGEECDDGNNVSCDGCSSCKIDKCGDGRICGSEQCDGANLNNKNCTNFGFLEGSLSCSNCTFNTSNCTFQVVPCTLKRAYWTDSDFDEYSNSSNVKNNTIVFLKQELNGNCQGKQVSFIIRYGQNITAYPGYLGLVNVNNETAIIASWKTNNLRIDKLKVNFRTDLIASSQFNISGNIVIVNTTNQEEEECLDYANFTCCNSSLCNNEIPLTGCSSGKKCCLSCNVVNTTNYPFTGCGDGVKQAGEQCDSYDLGEKTCSDIDNNYIGGSLRCYSNCTFNTKSCFIESGFSLANNSQKKSSEKESSLTALFIIILIILFLIIILLVAYYFLKVKGYGRGSSKNFKKPAPPGPPRMPPMVSPRPVLTQQARKPFMPQRMIAQRPN